MSKQQRKAQRCVLVVTGSRAEFGLLRPVMDAVRKHRSLELRVCVAGEHLLGPAHTWREVARGYRIDAKVPMQRAEDRGRFDHAAATGRGLAGFAAAYRRIKPDWVVVLGDRIEAFAAASAASIAGIAVCHIHGGDRAEGIADEAMRHAITKLAHVHCAATQQSAERILKMGERKDSVFVTGSPAIDGLAAVKPMSGAALREFGDPRAVVLLHPSGLSARDESFLADRILGELSWCGCETVVVLAPNSDPGSAAIRAVYARWQKRTAGRFTPAHLSRSGANTPRFAFVPHLPRNQFVALLKRLAIPTKGGVPTNGLLIGNSSAGLIEAAAAGLPVVNIGERQAGRERGDNVVDVPFQASELWATGPLEGAILRSTFRTPPSGRHPYGDGRAGERIAAALAKLGPRLPELTRKRNRY